MSQLKWVEPSEKDIETAILYFLNYQAGVFAFKVNTMGVYDQRGGFYRRPSKFVMSGTPDIISVVRVGTIPVFVGFECKSPKGRQSNDQKEFQERLESKADGFYFIVKCIKDVENALIKVNERVETCQIQDSFSSK